MTTPHVDLKTDQLPFFASTGGSSFINAFSRRRFLALTGMAGAGVLSGTVSAAEPHSDHLRIGVMLQGGSAPELEKNAKAIAEAGFNTIQLSFFFDPKAHELETLARTLKELTLKVVVFGTYLNPLRPEDASFMGSSIAGMKQVAAQAELFDCNQFITWGGSYSKQFGGKEPRNHTEEAVKDVQRALTEVVLPVLKPIDGRVALEPYYPHVFGTLELAAAILKPFPTWQVGLVVDPPNFISPELYPRREAEMTRLFSQLGEQIHLAHFKDLKLDATGKNVDLPGPGLGVMDYRAYARELRRLNRPVNCILEHINPDTKELTSRKAWVEQELKL
jgi:sugar phosphate isomerase/epimerase